MSALGSLVRVDRLVITFLVDNTIEWFGKLPPGFKNELRNQLSNDPPIDPKTGAPIIDLENFCCGAHGFSALIETTVNDKIHTLLFDTGPDSKSIIRNVHALKAEEKIKKLERIVLSHWHKDHSGGLLSLLELRNTLSPDELVTVDLHPDRPVARGIAPPPTYTTVIGRLPEDPTFEEVESRKGIVEKNSEGHLVAGDTIFVSGAIPRITDFESGGLLGSVRWYEEDGASSGKWKPEPHIMDERYAAINVKGKGLVIFTACSHAGVVNVVRDAIKQFTRPIHMVVGGLHLGGPELYDRIEPTVHFLSQRIRPAPTYVLPMHCSGFPVKVALQKELGEGCIPAGTGMVCEILAGSQELDERLSVSIK